MIVPHPHQTKMLDETRAALREFDAVLLQSPTGSGKTVLGTLMAQGASGRGRRIMFTVHRDFLVEQTSATFDKVGLRHGIVAAGYTPSLHSLVQVASIDTLKHRLDKVIRPDLLIVDESHHSVAAGWARVIGAYLAAGTKVIGLTATPIRLDGRGLGEYYQHLVQGPKVRWLIDNGYLCDYQAYAPTVPDLSGVHSRMGDYIKAEVEAVLDKPTITGDAIREYQKRAPGKRAVAFCISVKHSEHVRDQFLEAGIAAAHIDANTPKANRKAVLARFRAGDVKVLTSVDIFGEGFDLPSVEVAILLRPTQSLSLHLQQIGRALRTDAGKERAIILDHAGNLMKLGLPDTEFEWSLEGRPKGRKKKGDEDPVFAKQCESCYAMFWPLPTCPHCGHTHEVQLREGPAHVDGELTRLTPEMIEAMRVKKRQEVGQARTLEDLEKIARERGYKPGWARNILLSREKGGAARAEAQARAYGGRWG